jgi:hypothetical protein
MRDLGSAMRDEGFDELHFVPRLTTKCVQLVTKGYIPVT